MDLLLPMQRRNVIIGYSSTIAIMTIIMTIQIIPSVIRKIVQTSLKIPISLKSLQFAAVFEIFATYFSAISASRTFFVA